MVNMIKRDVRLAPYLKTTLEDEGIVVEIDPNLSQEEFAAIKVDDYYAGQRTGNPPKAVDFVVVVDCQCDSFALYILEFKNVHSPRGLVLKDIHEKFENTIESFLKGSFAGIFLNDRFKYKRVKLYLVSDAYGAVGRFPNHAAYLERMTKMNKKDTLKVDMRLSEKLYKFRGRILRIEYDIPPNPLIKRVQ